ncbi:MAG: EAL domain-containing response regulator [Gammaproteobacteria bacterium]|nr:EAL domain-containing response regulator [Gammaproteobacteria bacterium]
METNLARKVDAAGNIATIGAPLLPESFAVLVVEDDDFQRELVAQQLQILGVAKIYLAADGVEALMYLHNYGPAIRLILCDLEMPNMDGLEFIRHLSCSGSDAELAITSGSEQAVLRSVHTLCQAQGVTPLDVLEKPITNRHLKQLLDEAMVQQAVTAAPPKAQVPELGLLDILTGIENEEFEPHYQAKLDTASGRIVGAEALARWRHPQHGLLSPEVFIEPLEQAGEIDKLTFKLLAQAAADCRAFCELGLELRLSVNLSRASLADPNLAHRIHAIVCAAGVRPAQVMLEITETAAMTNVAVALENLARLRLRGFGLAIDDFGTGFASMEQLGRVAFTEIKIDRSFISNMHQTREARTIVESTIDIARRLGIDAVAEGVETGADWLALRKAGCPLVQGNYVSRPLPRQKFIQFCETRK